ncbi:hypothetical protein M2459_003194 [Parabacteroides sp. PF5-5]|nr:hypothetical protein [Parabacteroides sp. PH5-39]MDH6317378.1 hypothetical protein [Parabacteroides sp. PF5-13]MDH6321181.1 hypothetical protein [Parabacteroides sp. PH5-13]MDH6324913.1 hypothetical protein [Parabacteroides sp. PH5-8]MDH6328563.1 hypothetical protein [Parabacteroides sp. PH5-41]MDH6336424.1 hypothetical protein [Parabacteroides sp. PF5-5]MDH6347488.1 hypothetical protein [Parabacteroides sp. PH5-46]MDH6362391.1 hypothetical protein [Parabacteroides sp. PH5-16]MDH6378118.
MKAEKARKIVEFIISLLSFLVGRKQKKRDDN